MLHKAIGIVLVLTSGLAFAQERIDLTAPIPQPMSGHLKMGGKDPDGIEINVNSRYLTFAGKPWFPVMGEFHYSRYPHQDWERELLKMKAGGITCVSTYIFWIHHEEIEGQFDWSGDRDLRQFVQLCAKCGLYCYLRLGPWDHGEARNGGFPDWLMAKVPARRQRTTDPVFMGYTRALYEQIFKQVQGLLWKDGGPIIGVQVENELRNSAPYLLALKNVAKEVGFDVPLYSQTGWGPARVPQDELLPMFGGYSDGFWLDNNAAVAPAARVQFFFTHNPNDERTRVNTSLAAPPPFMAYLSRYPYLTCEIGDGMAISYNRRPLMTPTDIAAAALCKLGDGSNMLGYYMYHGGGNPRGQLSTLQETQATDYPNDMPVINYDFQAPLGQFGQVRPTYHALRRLHLFVADFGGDLCNMTSTLPAKLPADLNDTQTLRWAVRSDGRRGYIFINNHERGVTLPAEDAQFDLRMADGDQIIPAAPVKIPSDGVMFWPFNFDLNGVTLRYATAQPLCKVMDGSMPCYCFFAPAGIDPEFAFDAKELASLDGAVAKDAGDLKIISGAVPFMLTVHASDGQQAKILLLNEEQSMRLWKATEWGQPRLFLSKANLVFDDPNLTILSTDPGNMSVSIYPPPATGLTIDGKTVQGESDGLSTFTHYAASASAKTVKIEFHKTKDAGPTRELHLGSRGKPEMPSDADFDAAAVWQISIPHDALDGGANVCLNIDYSADCARAYLGDQLIDDDFYDGQPWQIGLNRFAPEVLAEGLTIKILPLPKDSPVYIQPDLRPKPDNVDLRGIEAQVEYENKMRPSNN
jgi:beta-galactosidase